MSEKKLPPFISIIALTHNDKENLSTLLQRIAKTLESYRYELIIVDDNGTDGMAEEAEILCRQYPVKFIDSKDRRGFASAVIAGFNLARGEILGLINTDQQHPPEKIPELLQAIENGADIAVASRYSSGSGIESRNKKGEDIFPRATMLARLALPSVRNVRDPMSGFFLLKRKVLDGVVLKPGYKILPQVLATGGGNEVIEVPYIENIVKQKGALQFRGQLDYLWNFVEVYPVLPCGTEWCWC